MSRRYTYSRSIRTEEGVETFTAEEFDSFDEAKNAVDRGINDRKLQIAAEKKAQSNAASSASTAASEG